MKLGGSSPPSDSHSLRTQPEPRCSVRTVTNRTCPRDDTAGGELRRAARAWRRPSLGLVAGGPGRGSAAISARARRTPSRGRPGGPADVAANHRCLSDDHGGTPFGPTDTSAPTVPGVPPPLGHALPLQAVDQRGEGAAREPEAAGRSHARCCRARRSRPRPGSRSARARWPATTSRQARPRGSTTAGSALPGSIMGLPLSMVRLLSRGCRREITVGRTAPDGRGTGEETQVPAGGAPKQRSPQDVRISSR